MSRTLARPASSNIEIEEAAHERRLYRAGREEETIHILLGRVALRPNLAGLSMVHLRLNRWLVWASDLRSLLVVLRGRLRAGLSE